MQLIKDLQGIKSVSDDCFNEVFEAVSKEQGNDFEKLKTISSLIQKNSEDEVYSILRFLDFLSSNLSDARDFYGKLNKLQDKIELLVHDEPDAREGWQRIRSRLDNLDNFFLREKEKDIKRKFRCLEHFEITTDTRPVFSLDRKKIIKHIYPCILKIQTIDNQSFICEFYENQIDELISELELCKTKLSILKGLDG